MAFTRFSAAPTSSSLAPLGIVSVTLAVCLFLAIWGAKLIAIDHYGSDLPYWDQWGKEGELLLTPWFERHEIWKNLFVPHNEHRIAPTLALNLALVTGGGQWDARVQCVVSGILHAAIAVSLFIWALHRFPRRWALAAGIVLILAIAPPIAWENVLGGFQSGFYFLAGFSLLALHLLLNAPALSMRWFGGLVSGLLALVSMGSGLLVAAPLLAIITVRFFAKNSSRRDIVITLVATLFIAALGAWLRTPTPWHDTLHAKTASGFLTFAARCLSWPLPQHLWLAPLIWLPWFALLFLRIYDLRVTPAPRPSASSDFNTPTSRTAATTDFLLAAGSWVLLQIAAVSFSRAAGGSMPASRYGDIAALGLILCFLSLAHLATSRTLLPRLSFTIAGVSWLGLVTLCVALATRTVMAGPLPDKKRDSVIFERSVQAFVLTDDYDAFDKSPRPFPFTDWLARILRNPKIRAVLPTSVRAPLRIDDFPSEKTSPAPALSARRIHTLTTAGEWRSKPLQAAKLGWWTIETAGPAFSASTTALSLVSPTSSVFVSPSAPSRSNGWQTAYLPAPHEPVSFVANTASAKSWLAFSEPVEISSLSYRTWQIAKHGQGIFIAGLVGFMLTFALSIYFPRQASAASGTC